MSLPVKSSHKKHRSEKDKSSKIKHKDKGKAKAIPEEARQYDSPFLKVTSSMRLSIPPAFASNLRRGAEEMLDSMIMRYSPALDAVLLAYSELEFDDNTAELVNDCPFAVCDIWFDAVVWAPKVGMRLHGIHSLSSPSHISLILHKTFNVSIPLENIPQGRYTFEEADEADLGTLGEEGVVELSGRWKDTKTGKMVGDGKEEVGFVVTGLQTSNQMLSLTGSLLPSGSSGVSHSNPGSTRTFAPTPGTQLANEIASRPSTSTKPAHLPSPGENLVTKPKPKKLKQKEHATTSGANIASEQDVNQAVHEAQPQVQGPAVPDIEDEDLRRHRKEQKKAEKEAKKQSKRSKESHQQTAAQAEERAGAMLAQVKQEKEEASSSPAGKEKKQKRSAEDAAVGEKATKRKKL